MGLNQRKFPRFDFEEVIHVYFISPVAKREAFSSRGKNISQDGLCLETPDFLLPSQILRLDFHLTQAFQTFAMVTWSERDRCGVRFLYREKELETCLESLFPFSEKKDP